MGRRKWTQRDLEKAAEDSTSIRMTIKKIGLIPAGGNYAQVNKYLKIYKIDITHFKGRGWSKGLKGIGKPIIPLEKVLIKNSYFQSYKLKNRLFKERLRKQACEICGWAKKSIDGRIPVELDHINGNNRDNRLKNLRILCPNCHSLQLTHRGKNKKRK